MMYTTQMIVKNLRNSLLALCLLGGLAACADPENRGSDETGDNQKVDLQVSVPKTYTLTSDDKESKVETLDVLVFGTSGTASGYVLRYACQGVPVEGTWSENRYTVYFPIGSGYILHVFANCREQLTTKGAFTSIGTDMDALLKRLTVDIDCNLAATESLPMHGYKENVSITGNVDKNMVYINLLRTVAGVQVGTNATITTTDDKQVVTPGTLNNFKLKEVYTYFQMQHGQMAPAADAYETASGEAARTTRDVTQATLPATEDEQKVHLKEQKVTMTGISESNQLSPCIYLYENKPITETNGYEIPTEENNQRATTRIIVGGLYGTDREPSYYRINFTGEDGKTLTDILRNNKYTLNIKSVTGRGYATPDEAAENVPAKIVSEVISWKTPTIHIDFNNENWFKAETKTLILPRYATTTYMAFSDISSDVPFQEDGSWEMGFESTENGTISPVKTTTTSTMITISNNRFDVLLTKNKLSIRAHKDYSDLNGDTAPSHTDVLYIRVKNLTVKFNIEQVDRSPDDWGDGGNTDESLKR